MYSTSSLADRMKHEVYPNNEQMDVDKSDLVREVFEIEYRADNDNDNDIATSSNIVTAKRKRTKYSIMQLEILENEFKNNVYLTGRRRTELAKQLSLKEAHIKVWFQNRRMKYKKDMETGRLHNKNINKNMAAQNQHNALVHRLLSYSQNVGCTRVTANTNKCNQNASLCIMKENESISEDIASKKRLDDTLKESATVFMATNSKYKTHNFDTNQINNEMYALHNLNNINNENISIQKPCPTENGAMYYQKLSHESQILANPYKTDLLPAQNLLNMPQANSEVHSSKSYCHPKSDNMPKTFGRDNSNNLLSMPLKSNELSNTMANSDVNDQDITTPQILTLNTELSQQSNEFSFFIYENVIGLDDIWFN